MKVKIGYGKNAKVIERSDKSSIKKHIAKIKTKKEVNKNG